MPTDRATGLPDRAPYRSTSQPYYLRAGDYSAHPSQFNLLHKLCSALNRLGFEAHLESQAVCGSLWTPVLSEAVKVAHYQAGKRPIVVSSADAKGPLGQLGLQVRYLLEPTPPTPMPDAAADGATEGAAPPDAAWVYCNSVSPQSGQRVLRLPLMDADARTPRPAPERSGIAFFLGEYLAAGGAPRDFGAGALDLAAPAYASEDALLDALCQVSRLYLFEPSRLIDLARMCGCPVTLVPNAFTLKELPASLAGPGGEGVAWGEEPAQAEAAARTVWHWRARQLAGLQGWQDDLQAFIRDTQAAAAALPLEQAWPIASVDQLDIRNLTPAERGARADRSKYRRINEQYQRWKQYCSIREVDADIYAEHLAAGAVAPVSVVIDQRGHSLDALADTLDSLSQCLWQPAHVLIVSAQPAPEAFEPQGAMQWCTVRPDASLARPGLLQQLAHWVLAVQAGTRLAAHSLVEWGLAVHTFAQAEIIYADEDFGGVDGQQGHPFFKPDANTELLRCTNYLGNAVLVRSMGWVVAGCPLFDGALYAYALQLLRVRGRAVLAHIDTVLVHSSGLFRPQQESQEFNACTQELGKTGTLQSLRPLERLGTWLPTYASPADARVSLVIPTGLQTGYLRSLLDSLQRYPAPQLAEVVLVCAPDQRSEVEYALAHVQLDLPCKLVPLAQEAYNHAAALNAGIQAAAGSFILVCDDDTELLHANWLEPLLGLASQDDVGCVAPRLLSHRGADARVSGGPLVLGIQGAAAPYNGELGLLEECGVQSRLQLTQDVGAVAGHCFVLRKSDWQAVGGFDSERFGLWFTVLDFCLRQGQRGKRHVWTPLVGVMHQGGKTMAALMGDTRTRLRLADCELTERNLLLQHWSQALAKDGHYNRHLSLVAPYDIEHTIVVDWQPRRRDRPRVLACPLTSGAGQYRVVEPLNALQDASLAQTCAVIPLQRGHSRVLQPLELVRAAPDRLILQHSVDDAQIGMIEQYRLAMPGIMIIQMVDDVLGEVPAKHPSWNFQKREGHQRMVQALRQSDRLIVTTETLRQHYQKYVADVRLLPNCLDRPWAGLNRPHAEPARLRVGWVGAGQHKGDLELVGEVVRRLAPEVDWVFMGMCTEDIKPYIKEFHGFVPIGDYPRKMASLQLDIAIAPLESHLFNACKSNLRLLEYGAMGWPVVCSDVFPYRTDDPPVIRCSDSPDDWEAALRRLMHDVALRQQMGAALHQWVQTHYLLKDRLQEWQHAIFDAAQAASKQPEAALLT